MAPKKRCSKEEKKIQKEIQKKIQERIREVTEVILVKQSKKKRKIEKVILVKQRNNLAEKKRREREKRPWSDLPEDLLTDIMERNYSWADKIRFRAVCKRWQQLPIDHVDNAEINKLPWVVTVDWTDNLAEEKKGCINKNHTSSEMSSCVLNCKLFHPKHPNPYSVNKILFKDRRIRLCSSMHGWLLFENKKHNNDNLTSFFFLFSPFTRQFIHLPYLDNCIPGTNFAPALDIYSFATFSSSDPYNDPDCEFIVLRDYFYPENSNRIAVSTCRRGDQNWTTRIFHKWMIQNWYGPIRQVLYCAQRGYLCCYTNFHTLAAYSVTRKEWIQLINPEQMQLLDGMFYAIPHLIECEGGFLAVTLYIGPNYDDDCRLFKFSWSSSNWNIESSLPNQAIFVGPTSFLVPASGDIANKIYYHELHSDPNLKCYCFKDRKSRKYLQAAVDDDYLHRGWLAKGMLQDGVIWIQST